MALFDARNSFLGETHSGRREPRGHIKLYTDDSDFVVAATGSYVLHLVRRESTTSSVDALRRAMGEVCAQHERLSYVCVLDAAAKIQVEPAVGQGFRECAQGFQSHLQATAVVLEAQGFAGNLLRNLVRQMYGTLRADYPTQVFSDPSAAIAWLTTALSDEPAAGRLQRSLGLLRLTLP